MGNIKINAIKKYLRVNQVYSPGFVQSQNAAKQTFLRINCSIAINQKNDSAKQKQTLDLDR